MDDYTFLRGFADTWAMLALFLIFIGIIIWTFRPGSGQIHKDSANQIFRNDSKPGDNSHGH